VTAALASSTIRLGVYASSSDAPGALIADFGTVSGATTGLKDLTISQALSAGLYYFAVVRQGGTGTLTVRAIDKSFTSIPASGTTFMHDFGNIQLVTTATISGALPGTITPTYAVSANPFPSVLVRVT
jgi:hypothetical protein